jgi:L-alanine-DL-glutamate epimerase-like enolase superfamily enzyme
LPQYLEQPMRVGTVEEYRQLRSRIRTPVAINEDAYYRNNLRQLLAANAVDVAVVDLVLK